MGFMATLATVLVGCGTPRVGPAKTTLDRMNGVEPLASLEETRGDNGTNIVKKFMSPTMAQYQLRMKELEGNTQAAVAQANRPPAYIPAGYGSYGYQTYGGTPAYTPPPGYDAWNYQPTQAGYGGAVISAGGGNSWNYQPTQAGFGGYVR